MGYHRPVSSFNVGKKASTPSASTSRRRPSSRVGRAGAGLVTPAHVPGSVRAKGPAGRPAQLRIAGLTRCPPATGPGTSSRRSSARCRGPASTATTGTDRPAHAGCHPVAAVQISWPAARAARRRRLLGGEPPASRCCVRHARGPRGGYRSGCTLRGVPAPARRSARVRGLVGWTSRHPLSCTRRSPASSAAHLLFREPAAGPRCGCLAGPHHGRSDGAQRGRRRPAEPGPAAHGLQDHVLQESGHSGRRRVPGSLARHS